MRHHDRALPFQMILLVSEMKEFDSFAGLDLLVKEECSAYLIMFIDLPYHENCSFG